MTDKPKNRRLKLAWIKPSKRFGVLFLCFLISLFALYAALGFWILPSYFKSKAKSIASEKLHRQLVINKLEFNPFVFTLNIEGVSLSEPDSEAHFVTFDQLFVDISPLSVLKMTPIITELKLVKPFARVIRLSEKERNFDDIVVFFKTEDDPKSAGSDKPDENVRPKNEEERRAAVRRRKFGIYNFQIIDARIELENREKGTKTLISDFNVGLPCLYRGPVKGIARHVEPRLDAMINGKRLEVIREAPLANTMDRTLKLNMDNIDLTRIFNYVPFNPEYKFKKGWLDMHLLFHIRRPKDAQMSVDIGGQLTFRSIHMTQFDKPLLNLEKLDLHLGEIAPSKDRYCIDRMEIVRPEIYAVSDKKGVLNFTNLLKHTDKEVVSAKSDADDSDNHHVRPVSMSTVSASESTTAIILKELAVKNAKLHYDDQSAVLPIKAFAEQLAFVMNDTAIDLNTNTIQVGKLLSSSGRFNVAAGKGIVRADPKMNKKSSDASGDTAAFHIGIDQIDISNWSGKISNTGTALALPVLTAVNKLGIKANKVAVDLNNQKVQIAEILSSGGDFDVLMENHPPQIPIVAKKEQSASYHVQIGSVNVSNWSGKVKNTNRHDPFERPFSASISQFGFTVGNADINLKEQLISVKTLDSRNADISLELHPYKKPTDFGKRAQARAALLSSIMKAKENQPAEGMAVKVDKAGIAGWSVRVKNQNKTDRAGLPVSGAAEKVQFTFNQIKVDTGKRILDIAEVISHQAMVKAQLEKHEKFSPKITGTQVVMPSEKPYAANIGKLMITGWSLKGRNINLQKSIGGAITDLSVTGKDISSVPGKTNALAIHAVLNKTGQINIDAKAAFSPLNVEAKLNLKDVSIVAIQPYIDDYVNLTIDKAQVSAHGNLLLKTNPAGALEGGYQGDLVISNLRTVDQIKRDLFVRWNHLALTEIDAKLNPLFINVKKAELDNFFARLILGSDGRLNLRNILRSRTGGQKSLTETDEEMDELAAVADKEETVDAVNIRTKAISQEENANVPLVIEKLELKKGRVRFTDNFIKPHYTANIANMEGSITELTSDPDKPAKVDIRGLVNNAPLVAAGTISPFKAHLTLDIKAQVRGMELAQFSSYTAKYIGYGIEKGKLSFDIEYKLTDGVLVAKNRLILDQLMFGEKMPGESVTSLPIELAVSLLKNSDGIIDIHLPIGGSLDDPSFSLGDILAKVFLSSLKRVILSPFSFLSLNFGSGAELSWLDFEPGSALIPEKEIAKLEVLAKALGERKELKLDITGRYDPAADGVGLAKEAVKRKVRLLKFKDLLAQGKTIKPNQIHIDEKEYPELLQRVYDEADFSKPRNFIGMQKKLSTADMEKLMVDNYEAKEEELLALAYQRSEYVKAWLVKTGKIADSRIFLLASKAGTTGENGETAARVDFAMQ